MNLHQIHCIQETNEDPVVYKEGYNHYYILQYCNHDNHTNHIHTVMVHNIKHQLAYQQANLL
nr:MAG TPA: hypothetical protein [Crassvirales sp.]